jgi:hypothetical protein
MLTPEETDILRREVKKKMVDLYLDRPGSIAVLSNRLADRLGRSINSNSLVMALSGYREGPAAQQLLQELDVALAEWQPENPCV